MKRASTLIELPRQHLIEETPSGYWLLGTFDGEPPDGLRSVELYALQSPFRAVFWMPELETTVILDDIDWRQDRRQLWPQHISDIIEAAAVEQGVNLLGRKRKRSVE